MANRPGGFMRLSGSSTTVRIYEIGAKSHLAEGAVALDTSVYY